MPKVNEAHFERKRNQILQAAKRVCMSKPIYKVAMRDIVIESGLSQGGVYKYFSDIDEVFTGLLNEHVLTEQVKAEVDDIFGQNKEPIEIVEDFLQYTRAYVQKAVEGNGKVYFELTALYANEPDRFLKVRDKISEVHVLIHLHTKFVEFIDNQVQAGHFEPGVPLDDIHAFITTSVHGIVHSALRSRNLLQGSSLIPTPSTDRLFKSLSYAVRKMLTN